MVTSVAIPLLVLNVLVSSWGSENLPSIPAGRRAEYYLLQDDGSYKYGYDTGEGQSALVNADQGNQVQGLYSYINNAGQKVSLSYTAGDAGFVPNGAVGVVGTAGSTLPKVAGLKNTGDNGGYATGSGLNDDYYDANSDASYAFSIDTDTYKRTETSDARGNVRGKYSYSSPGGSHELSYVAGENTGFVVTGGNSGSSNIAAPSNSYVPSVPSSYSGGSTSGSNTVNNINTDGSYSFSYNTNDQSRDESGDAQNNVRGSYSFRAKDDGKTRRVDYSAGAATGFVATGDHLPVPPSSFGTTASQGYSSFGQSYPIASDISSSQGTVGSDGSYSFSYDAGDSSRQESADTNNNVHGSFSFRAKDDGQTRHVDYEAGAATGFIAKGSHLPVAPTAYDTSSSGGYSGNFGSQSLAASAYSGAASGSAGDGDASYSFSYNTGDQSRQEASDAQGNVNGQFSYVAGDGVERKVEYTAGAEKGFIAKGAHIPVAPEGNAVGSSTQAFSGGASSLGKTSYSGGNSYSSNNLAIGGGQSDGSYSFSYDAGDHSRQETGDANNNVHGSYSFTAKDDGLLRKVDYEAGAATGFLARGSHLPTALSSPSAPSSYSSSAIGVLMPYSQSLPSNPYSGSGGVASTKSSGPSSDGSYSFSYNAGDHSREESSDAQGNVRGTFSYTSRGDGQTRKVDYEASADKGFVAKGAHLPTPLPVKGLGSSTGRSLGYQSTSGFLDSSADNSKSYEDTGDASYSYNYKTDTSSKQETSDAQGNVVGSYSFIGGDGVSRSIQYTSKGDEGFVVSGNGVSYAANSQSSGQNSLSQGTGRNILGRKSQDLGRERFQLQKFLPPENSRRFGYVFDTKV